METITVESIAIIVGREDDGRWWVLSFDEAMSEIPKVKPAPKAPKIRIESIRAGKR